MARIPKEDFTINQYATELRSYMGGYSQREIAEALDWHEKELSSLLNGRAFPSKDKIDRLLEWLCVPVKARGVLVSSINEQRLFPVIADPFIGHRIHALRAMAGKKVSDIADDELSESTWIQVESGLTSVGVGRELAFSDKLKTNIHIDPVRRARLNSLLKNYSEEDLLTIGYYLANKLESRNNKR